jgi:prophage regulatory protein
MTRMTIHRLPSVLTMTGLSRTNVYKQIAAKTFPAPVKLGARAVGWLEAELETWLAARVDARAGHVAL